ncbi:hypothetical protein ACN6LM_006536, partial [Streptomyces sp. SAS_281]|uniref:hypothetical protein n=1 Tax=Streptomyces sp. SAS_281 TaxID=3412744 RepID=UPI00403C1732
MSVDRPLLTSRGMTHGFDAGSPGAEALRGECRLSRADQIAWPTGVPERNPSTPDVRIGFRRCNQRP